eukprot:Nk52_evm3s312 gene=Nk52_evmTU3s312
MMNVRICQAVVLITAALCISSLRAFAAPMNEDDPFSPILLGNDAIAHPSLKDASHKTHDIISKTAAILSSPVHNVRVPPSERTHENNMLKHRRSDIVGQTVDETRSHLKGFGSVNTMADAVSVVSLAKINALYAQKYANEKDDTHKFTNFTSIPYTPWGSSTEFWVDLVFGPPLWVFVDATLQMTMELQAGSKIYAKRSDGSVMTKELRAGVPVTTAVSLTRVAGKFNDFSVAINITQTEWSIKMDIKNSTIDPSFESYVTRGLQQYFTETFHDKDYILGTLILNPEDPKIISGMNPKAFIMEAVEDAYSRSGNGFLVIMIQTDGAALTDMTRKQNPIKFNMVPDGYDSALYITNRALYNSIFMESFKPVVSNLQATGDGKGGLTYKTGGLALGKLTQPSGCANSDSFYGGCKYTEETNMVYTTDFVASYANDATPNRLSIHAARKNIHFLGCSATPMGRYGWSPCRATKADGIFTLDMDFDFVFDKTGFISVNTTSSHAFNGDFASNFWDNVFGISKEYLKKTANVWGDNTSKAVTDNPPKIQSLNTFRLERILFPYKNIYSYKEVHVLSDLVLFGHTVPL